MRKIALVMAMTMALTSVNTGALSAISPTYTVSAAQTEENQNTLFENEITNNDVTWQFNDGILTVSGTGVADNSYRKKYKANDIKKVVIKSGITAIGDGAFSKLKNLKKITIPNTVTKLGISCMEGLKMDKIVVPNSVKEIGSFAINSTIKNVTVPGNFKYVSSEKINYYGEINTYWVFPSKSNVHLNSEFNPKMMEYFGSAKKVYTAPKDKKYKTYGDYIYTKNGKRLIFVPGSTKNIKVRKGCKTMSAKAFCYYYYEEYDEDGGFKKPFCYPKKITIPKKVKIVDDCDYYCDDEFLRDECKFSFESKKLSGKTLSFLGKIGRTDLWTKKYGVRTEKGMFLSADNMLMKYTGKKKKITISKKIKSIAPYAFANNKKLESIKILGKVKKIDDYTFYKARRLKTVKLPKSITMIGKEAFSKTTKLKTVKLSNKVKTIGEAAFLESGLKKFSLPKKIKRIGKKAFCRSKIKSITLPKSVEKIGTDCFSQTKKMKKLVMNCNMKKVPSKILRWSSVKEVVLPKSATIIEKEAINYCNDLKAINFPENLTDIGTCAFMECKKLSSVQFNNKLKRIGDAAFANTSIKSVILPDSVEKCGICCFRSTPLQEIKFSKKMTSIPNYMCEETNIKNVVIPKNIKEIGYGVFKDCPLEHVDLQEGIERFNEYSFVGKSHYYENGKWNYKTDYDLVEISIPKSLKEIQVDIEKDKSHTFSYSANQNFDNAKVIEMTEKNPVVDISSLRDNSELYCKFVRTLTYKDSNNQFTDTMLYHFIFK